MFVNKYIGSQLCGNSLEMLRFFKSHIVVVSGYYDIETFSHIQFRNHSRVLSV